MRFALFILSHNRADDFRTLAMLGESDYNGDWFVVISTDDKQLWKYKEMVDDAHLLIFDKSCVDVDSMCPNSSTPRQAALYARNYIIDYAKERYDYFAMIDDDISSIKFRIDVDGRMTALCGTKRLSQIIGSILDFLEGSIHLGGIAFSSDRQYYGGVKSLEKIERECFCFVFLKSEDVRRYIGIMSEDAIYSSLNFDKVYLSIRSICFIAPTPGTNSGGVEYEKHVNPNFPWVMTCPSAIRLTLNGGRHRIKKYMYQQIINPKYKKQ